MGKRTAELVQKGMQRYRHGINTVYCIRFNRLPKEGELRNIARGAEVLLHHHRQKVTVAGVLGFLLKVMLGTGEQHQGSNATSALLESSYDVFRGMRRRYARLPDGGRIRTIQISRTNRVVEQLLDPDGNVLRSTFRRHKRVRHVTPWKK